jgi:phospholipid transport system substrate-binding protein
MRPPIRSQYVGIGPALSLLVVGANLLLFSPQAYAADAAETFVQTRIEAGHAILQDPQLVPRQRQQKFRDFMLSITDMRRNALFTAGTYARDAREPDVATFIAAFTEFSVSFYERVLDSYARQTIRVTGSARHSEDDAVVNAEVVEPNGKTLPLKIAFRVRKNEHGDPILTDLQVEGAWLALNQRSEFMSFLQQHRGDIAQLSRELDRRARSRDSRNEPQS